MKRKIATPMVPGYGKDDAQADKGGGVNLVPGAWQPPDRVTAEESAAARLWMQAFDADAATVSDRDLRKWLLTFLGNLSVNGAADDRELDGRVRMLGIAVDDRAAKHFTKESLRLAWKRFQFIPSANELMEFFDGLEAMERTEAQRLMAVLDVASRPPPPRSAPVDVEASMRRRREKQQRENRELAAKLGVPRVEVAPRLPRESDREYGARIAQEAMRLCEVGQKALRRDEAKLQRAKLDEARSRMVGEPPVPRAPKTAENSNDGFRPGARQSVVETGPGDAA